MGGWHLRVALPDDADAVSALLARSYPAIWALHYPADQLAAVLPFVTRANGGLLASGRFFVAMTDAGNDGALAVACGGWSAEWPGPSGRCDPGVAHIRHFATDPDWLRRGIGRAVLDHCIREARNAGFSTLMADAAHGAESFYAASGFSVIGPGAAVIGGVAFPGSMMRG